MAETATSPWRPEPLYLPVGGEPVRQAAGDGPPGPPVRPQSPGVTSPRGRCLYQYVRSALGLIATGEDKLSQAQQLLLGSLVIGASDTVTGQFLTPYLEAFHRLHPGIRLKIVSGRSAKVLALLRSGAVDIAFASSPADPGLVTWPCFATHTVLWQAGYECDFDHVHTRQEIASFS